jgi:hypothetical protein
VRHCATGCTIRDRAPALMGAVGTPGWPRSGTLRHFAPLCTPGASSRRPEDFVMAGRGPFDVDGLHEGTWLHPARRGNSPSQAVFRFAVIRKPELKADSL